MKVRFIPNDVAMFRDGEYDFSERGKTLITLQVRHKLDFRDFANRQELTSYLLDKAKGGLDLVQFPLKYEPSKQSIWPFHKEITHCITQGTFVFGWMKEFV